MKSKNSSNEMSPPPSLSRASQTASISSMVASGENLRIKSRISFLSILPVVIDVVADGLESRLMEAQS